ncbi:MAG: ABC transporter ATP-binding protein [Deltaproteobacteria bacterium]|nr:ABC transporter ATP-binding protein [Deltaproteobacteria bacterium]
MKPPDSLPNEDISLLGVTKVFKTGLLKKKVAVDNLSFVVPPGRVVGLVGPNGSGKSTTLKMILGFLQPSAGEISICGLDARSRRVRSLIGYLPENPRFQKFLSARDILFYYGRLHGISGSTLKAKADSLLELVNLQASATERVGGFSKGMIQRLAIAQALLNDPRILIFDEPMSGLDPVGRREIRRLILRIHAERSKATILFSSHVLSDVEQLCSSVILLREGRLLKESPITELLSAERERYDINVKELPVCVRTVWSASNRMRETPQGITLGVEGIDELLGCLSQLRDEKVAIIGISSQRKTLEDALFGEPGQTAPSSLPAQESV